MKRHRGYGESLVELELCLVHDIYLWKKQNPVHTALRPVCLVEVLLDDIVGPEDDSARGPGDLNKLEIISN